MPIKVIHINLPYTSHIFIMKPFSNNSYYNEIPVTYLMPLDSSSMAEASFSTAAGAAAAAPEVAVGP